MSFHVGQKVVCVDADNSGLVGIWENALVKGDVYTITAVGLTNRLDPAFLPCVLIAEIPRDEDEGFWEHRFRPLVERKTDISVFKAMLTDSKVTA